MRAAAWNPQGLSLGAGMGSSNPLYRAPGMSATPYMNLGMILYPLFRTFVG